MTAKDLLYKYIHYNHLWSKNDRLNERPSIIRRQEIESLQDAFGLSKKHANTEGKIISFISGKWQETTRDQKLNEMTNIQYLANGEFLTDRKNEKNHELIEKARSIIKEQHKNLPEKILNRSVSIEWMFNNLLKYRQEIYKVTYPSQGMLEGFSVGLEYSKHLQSELNKVINKNLEDIDHTLWLILDPSLREIELKQLRNEFNYPDVDLDKIDSDWRLKNY